MEAKIKVGMILRLGMVGLASLVIVPGSGMGRASEPLLRELRYSQSGPCVRVGQIYEARISVRGESLEFEFVAGPLPPCRDAGDFDDNGLEEILDPILTLHHLFLGTFMPTEPYRECGVDVSPDALSCRDSRPARRDRAKTSDC